MKFGTRLSVILCALAALILFAGCSSKQSSRHIPKKTSENKITAKNNSDKASNSKQTADTSGSNKLTDPSFNLNSPLTPEPDKSSEVISKIFGNKPSDKSDQVAAAKLLASQGKMAAPGAATAAIPRPTAKQLLMAIRARYAGMQSLRFEVISSMVAKQDGKVMKSEKGAKTAVLFKRPDKFVLKSSQSMMMGDGKSVCEYIIPAKRYMKSKMSKDVLQGMISSKQGVGSIGLLYGVDYTPAVSSMKLVNDAKINGKDAYVLSLNIKAPKGESVVQKLWVGKNDLIIYKNLVTTKISPRTPKGYKGKVPKSIEMSEEGLIIKCEPDAKLSDAAFTFNPPAGAKQVEEPKKVDLINKPAPDLSFKWTDGTDKHLSDFRGKTVVMSMWAFPGSAQFLPSLQGLFKDQKDDMQIIALNFNAEADKVSEILKKKGFTFPVAFANKEIAEIVQRQYGLQGFPTTIIIDAGGVIKQVLMGYPAQKDLLAAISKAK